MLTNITLTLSAVYPYIISVYLLLYLAYLSEKEMTKDDGCETEVKQNKDKAA